MFGLPSKVGGKVDLSLGGGSTFAVVGKEEPDDMPCKTHGASSKKGSLQSKADGDKVTSVGAMKKLTLVPELKRPVASARSSEGNHSVVALMAAGKFPDSPRPSIKRAMQNPATEKTKAWLMEESAQMVMATA